MIFPDFSSLYKIPWLFLTDKWLPIFPVWVGTLNTSTNEYQCDNVPFELSTRITKHSMKNKAIESIPAEENEKNIAIEFIHEK